MYSIAQCLRPRYMQDRLIALSYYIVRFSAPVSQAVLQVPEHDRLLTYVVLLLTWTLEPA